MLYYHIITYLCISMLVNSTRNWCCLSVFGEIFVDVASFFSITVRHTYTHTRLVVVSVLSFQALCEHPIHKQSTICIATQPPTPSPYSSSFALYTHTYTQSTLNTFTKHQFEPFLCQVLCADLMTVCFSVRCWWCWCVCVCGCSHCTGHERPVARHTVRRRRAAGVHHFGEVRRWRVRVASIAVRVRLRHGGGQGDQQTGGKYTNAILTICVSSVINWLHFSKLFSN